MFKFSTKRFVLVVETRIYCVGHPRTLLANFPASVSFERFESVTRSFWNIEGSSAVQYLGGGLSKPGSEAASTAAYCQNPPVQSAQADIVASCSILPKLTGSVHPSICCCILKMFSLFKFAKITVEKIWLRSNSLEAKVHRVENRSSTFCLSARFQTFMFATKSSQL